MLERKPWKRPRKGKKIPREKTDRDQSEPLLLFSFPLQWTPATQNLPGSLWPQGRLPGGGPAAGGGGGPKGPPNSTPLLRRHPTRDEPGTRALHLHGLTDTSWLVKIPMGPTLRAHAAHATIGTHTGSSLQPIVIRNTTLTMTLTAQQLLGRVNPGVSPLEHCRFCYKPTILAKYATLECAPSSPS